MSVLLLTLGFIVLIAGGELFVRGASRLAYAFGLSQLVIGLTVVALGTSSPEFSVAIEASLLGHMNISFGDVVGSNIVNVLVILGLTSIIYPFHIRYERIKVDMMIMTGSVIVFGLAAINLNINRLEAIGMVALAFTYMGYCLYSNYHDEQAVKMSELEFLSSPGEYRKFKSMFFSILLFILGAILLFFGAGLLVEGAIGVARILKLSEFVIGIFIVAIGTSLPELATCLVAVKRGKGDIAFGNILASNIYNLLIVLSGALALSPQIPAMPYSILVFHIPFMIFVYVLWFFLMRKYQKMSRNIGISFLLIYLLYVVLQVALWELSVY